MGSKKKAADLRASRPSRVDGRRSRSRSLVVNFSSSTSHNRTVIDRGGGDKEPKSPGACQAPAEEEVEIDQISLLDPDELDYEVEESETSVVLDEEVAGMLAESKAVVMKKLAQPESDNDQLFDIQPFEADEDANKVFDKLFDWRADFSEERLAKQKEYLENAWKNRPVSGLLKLREQLIGVLQTYHRDDPDRLIWDWQIDYTDRRVRLEQSRGACRATGGESSHHQQSSGHQSRIDGRREQEISCECAYCMPELAARKEKFKYPPHHLPPLVLELESFEDFRIRANPKGIFELQTELDSLEDDAAVLAAHYSSGKPTNGHERIEVKRRRDWILRRMEGVERGEIVPTPFIPSIPVSELKVAKGTLQPERWVNWKLALEDGDKSSCLRRNNEASSSNG